MTLDAAARDPLIGQTLGGAYTLTRLLSAGGMGNVYEAEHARLPKRFAVKVVRRELLADQVVFERFWREAQIAASLGNRHLVAVSDFNTLPDGSPYMVMEFLEGEDLAQRLARVGRLSPASAEPLLGQVVNALAVAHRHDIVHRDLKPENIFLARIEGGGEVVKLLDFGASKMKGARKLTADLTAVGTPWYMSPEQARARPDVDARSDQYALAVVLFELLAGKPPFDGQTAVEVMNQIVYSDVPRLRDLAPDAPPALDPVLWRAMSKDPGERYSSVEAFWEAAQLAFAVPLRPAEPTTEPELPQVRPVPPALPPPLLDWPVFSLGLTLVLFTGLSVWLASS